MGILQVRASQWSATTSSVRALSARDTPPPGPNIQSSSSISHLSIALPPVGDEDAVEPYMASTHIPMKN